jgi:hypothetical protein
MYVLLTVKQIANKDRHSAAKTTLQMSETKLISALSSILSPGSNFFGKQIVSVREQETYRRVRTTKQ